MASLVLLSLLLPASFILLYHMRKAEGRTDDSIEYLKLGRGEVAEGPFGRRWLAPLLCQDDLLRWKVLTSASIIGICFLLALQYQSIIPVILFLGLAALARVPMVLPVLVDMPSFFFALLAVMVPFPLNIPFALISGAFKETGPVFAAAWALDPTLLLGLLAVRWLHPQAPSDKPWLQKPLKLLQTSIPFHPWLDYRVMLIPWGALAVLAPVGLGLGAEPVAPILSLLLGYGSMLLARDRPRLYEWAFPALIPAAMLCPPWLTYPLLLPHLMNLSTEV